MSHLGTKILYGVLNKRAATSPASARSRPGSTARPSCARAGCRWSRSRSAAPLAEFDVIGILAAVRADLHQRAQRAGSVGGIPLRGADRGDDATAGHRGRSDRDPPRAAGAVHRRVLHRRGRGGCCRRWCARRRRCARAGVPRRERLIRLAASYPLYVPELYDDRGRRGDRPRSSSARPSIRACPARPQARAGRRHQPLPVPRRLAAAVRRGDLRSHGGRGGARLHRGLPLLPGGDDLPPGARARSGRGARDAGRRASRRAATTRPR